MSYKIAVGLETHVELKTNTKIFCSCSTVFGGEPNSHCCPVCIGLPGVLPSLNKRVVEFAVKAGLALNSKISNVSFMDRKNYSYPDLPKAYQITQAGIPLCSGGFVELKNGKKIGINRIHIEEDAGKLIHKDGEVFIDYNRAGVPLIEIVSEAQIESTEEAKEFLEKLRLIMRYIGVSDCKMQEGSMRCDVNVSVSKSEVLGTRTEIKNMNSIANILKAIEFESNRQIEVLESGREVLQQTLGFDEKSGRTYVMRTKEDADDYRFFREPDLQAIYVSDEDIERIKVSLPELFKAKVQRYVADFNLEEKDAELLAKFPNVARFFEAAAEKVKSPQKVANLILGVIFAFLKTETLKEEFELKIAPEDLSTLVALAESGKITVSKAKSLLGEMLLKGSFSIEEDTHTLSDSDIEGFCVDAINSNPKIVADYKGGKTKALMALVGAVMRKSEGRADAEKVKAKLARLLK